MKLMPRLTGVLGGKDNIFSVFYSLFLKNHKSIKVGVVFMYSFNKYLLSCQGLRVQCERSRCGPGPWRSDTGGPAHLSLGSRFRTVLCPIRSFLTKCLINFQNNSFLFPSHYNVLIRAPPSGLLIPFVNNKHKGESVRGGSTCPSFDPCSSFLCGRAQLLVLRRQPSQSCLILVILLS